jgi:sulfate permease, SulP family
MSTSGAEHRVPPIPPISGALGLRERQAWGREVIAGITVVALSLPMNIGYAAVAGLPASVGLYASIAPLAVFALTTGSRRLVVGPDATIAALLAAGMAAVVASGTSETDAALGAALLTAAFLFLAWLLRLGRLVRFLSEAVLVGFIAGLAVEILTSQVEKMLALDVDTTGWVREVIGIIRSIPEGSAASLAVGLSTIVIVRVLRRHVPKVPGALVALVVVGGAVALLDPAGVVLIGDVDAGLPRLSLPRIPLDGWLALAPISLSIAALTIAEGALVSKRAARAHGEEFDANADVFSYGVSNVAAALFGAMPIGASASRSAALEETGARTQVPALVAATLAAIVALFLTDLVAAIPSAALAGLVANAVIGLLDLPSFRYLASVRRTEFGIALSCAFGVLLLGALQGLVLAVLIACVDMVRRAAGTVWVDLEGAPSDPSLGRFTSHDGEPTPAGLRILRPGGQLFFANADATRDTLTAAAADPDVRWILIDLERVSDVDPTAAAALEESFEAAESHGTRIAVSRLTAPLRETMDRYGLLDAIGEEHIFASTRAGVDAFRTGTVGA